MDWNDGNSITYGPFGLTPTPPTRDRKWRKS
jgi:hypothetical protein